MSGSKRNNDMMRYLHPFAKCFWRRGLCLFCHDFIIDANPLFVKWLSTAGRKEDKRVWNLVVNMYYKAIDLNNNIIRVIWIS